MSKFTWVNGTKTTPARVEIDGTVYNVTDAEYEGETPLSAANLNTMYNDIGDVDDLETQTKTSCVAAINDLAGVVLYNDNDGSNTTVLLSDDIENYRYVEIYYKNNDNFYSSRKFYNPSGKMLVLDSYFVATTNVVFKLNYVTITNKTITRGAFAEVSNQNITSVTTTANTYITRVVGYK